MKTVSISLITFLFLLTVQGQTSHRIEAGGGGTGNPTPYYSPQFLTIQVNDTVIWDNVQGKHNVDGTTTTFANNPESFTNGPPAFAPWTFTRVFTTPGVYEFQCSFMTHSDTQFGTITVEPDSTIDTTTTSIQVVETKDELMVFPNPISESAWVHLPKGFTGTFALLIVNLEGKTYNYRVQTLNDRFRINLAHLSSGIYILKASATNSKTYSCRILVE